MRSHLVVRWPGSASRNLFVCSWVLFQFCWEELWASWMSSIYDMLTLPLILLLFSYSFPPFIWILIDIYFILFYLYASKNLLYIPNSIRTVFLFLTKTLCKCQLLLILSILSSYLVWSSLHYEITTIIMSILQSVKLRFRVFGSQPCPESQRRTWWSGVWAQEAELDPRVLALFRCLLPPWPSRWESCIIYPDHTYTPSLIYTGKN